MNTYYSKLWILYRDELNGFRQSKIMLILWLGLPALTLLLRLIQPNLDGMPVSYFTAIMTGSIGGTLSAVLIATNLTGERLNHVYDLFLVRPVGRGVLLVAKYLAAISCLLLAALLSVGLGLLADAFKGISLHSLRLGLVLPLGLSMASMAVAAAVGLLFGVTMKSVAGAAILSVYLGNQLSALVVLPAILLEGNWPLYIALAGGLLAPCLILALSIAIFKRQSL